MVRRPDRPLRRAASARRQDGPRHRYSVFYYLGGMALFLFVIQVVTGLLLLLYYEPGTATAYESVKRISGEIPFGWLVRSIHRWSADIFIGVLLLHMMTAFVMKAYRPPRELTWLTGVAALGLGLGFGFSGYLLPWDEIAFFATSVGTAVAGAVPLVGKPMLELLRGGEDVTGATLARFFALHVVVLPFAALGLLGAHLALVQKHGMSVPPGAKLTGPPRPFVPDFLLRDLVGWTLALALLAALAALFPAELGPKANPFASAPPGIKPEWYFYAPFQQLKMIPAFIGPFEGEAVGVVAMGLLGAVVVLVPFLDRKAARGEPSPWFTAVGSAIFIYLAVLTCYVWLH
ncbi:MAG TPA: cytochrome bc complex cytochrome b subunit [Vicinamibacteria bacterium]|nr:cytochrome bc complex cytochrome b subunit [Vicinamibacteria bacterium]